MYELAPVQSEFTNMPAGQAADVPAVVAVAAIALIPQMYQASQRL